MSIDFGKNIKKVRIYSGLNQKKFGRIINNSTQATVSAWELNKTHPLPDNRDIIVQISIRAGLNFKPEQIAPI